MYVIAFGFLTSLLISILVDRYTLQQHRYEFEEQSLERIAGIANQLNVVITDLKAIRGLFSATKPITRTGFREFVKSLEPGDSVQALEWIPRVTADRRRHFEDAARRDGIEGYRVSERQSGGRMIAAGHRPVYYPVYFVEPMQGNEAALGFDLGSDPARLEAIRRAERSGRATATSRVVLVQETGDQYGFLVFLPVYDRTPERAADAEVRQGRLIGFALGVFRIGDLIAAALQGFSDSVPAARILVTDLSAKPGEGRLFPRNPGERPESTGTGFRFGKTIDVAGRSWRISVVSPELSLWSATRWRTWASAAAGIAMALLIAYLIGLSQTAGQVEPLRAYSRALERSRETLERTNRELDQFASAASHDLQEPIRKLISFSEFLETDAGPDLPEDARTDLQVIRSAALRMRSLVQDLLALSRTGKITLAVQEVSAGDCANRALLDLQLMIDETGASVEMDELPMLRGDPTLVTQLYLNLISNGLKFARKGVPPVIHLTAEQMQDQTVLGVRDNGIGIDPKYARQIFQPFKRLHRRSEYDGSGIGLAICFKVVERHGGRIWVDDPTGHGTHIRFVLQAEKRALQG